MFFATVLINPAHSSFEHAEKRLDGVGGHVAACVPLALWATASGSQLLSKEDSAAALIGDNGFLGDVGARWQDERAGSHTWNERTRPTRG
jgi:hypothetical protein